MFVYVETGLGWVPRATWVCQPLRSDPNKDTTSAKTGSGLTVSISWLKLTVTLVTTVLCTKPGPFNTIPVVIACWEEVIILPVGIS